MRKFLFAAAGFAALAGAAGLAMAQQDTSPSRERGAAFFQADANSDGAVTRQEYDASRTARFSQLDTNNDGQLTREERRAERGDRGRHGRRGGGHDMLGGADANSDGNITREEFLARPTAMFARLDANSDGVISAAERPQRPERGQRPARADRPDRPERQNPDANNDGQFSQAEYVAAGARMFERLDANSDGRVTREEAAAAHSQGRGR